MSVPSLKPPGSRPGTLIHVGEIRSEFRVDVIEYGEDFVRKFSTDDLKKCHLPGKEEAVIWTHVTGLHDVDKIAQVAAAFRLHPLVTEDILNTRQRTKLEEHPDYLFIVADLPMLLEENDASFRIDHFSLLLTKGGVLTFCEDQTGVFDKLRSRLEDPSGRLRQRGSDYLSWAILDSIVDHLFVVLYDLEDRLDEMEASLAEGRQIDGEVIYRVRNQVAILHRSVRPMRELGSSLFRSDYPLWEDSTKKYLADLYDHCIHALETSEALRDHAAALRDFQMTLVSNRLNEVMKVLTCISTIFLPLGFLAGVYGMNFVWIPELGWKWGYPVLWGVFLSIAGGLMFLFVRKKWL